MWRRVLLGVASVLAVVGMLWGSVTPASACSCAPPPVEKLVDEATIVAIGSVQEMVLVPPLDTSAGPTEHEVRFVLTVEEYLKGSGHGSVTVSEPGLLFNSNAGQVTGGMLACPLVQEGHAGRRFLLLLKGGPDLYETGGGCSGSIPLAGFPGEAAHLNEVRAALAAPTLGLPRPGDAPTTRDGSVTHTELVLLGPLVFLAGAAFLWRPSRASG